MARGIAIVVVAEDAIAVRGTVSENKVRVSAEERQNYEYDAVDVAGSEEPRESSDREILSVSEDELRGSVIWGTSWSLMTDNCA